MLLLMAVKFNVADYIIVKNKAFDKIKFKKILMFRILNKVEKKYDVYNKVIKRCFYIKLLK